MPTALAILRAIMLRGIVCILLSMHTFSIPDSQECRNLLFETHWFSMGGSPKSLNEELMVHTNLRLCPAYNGIRSCCKESFEGEQLLHFNYWRQILTSKLERISKNRMGTVYLKQMEVFNAASERDRYQYERALQRYDTVLDPAQHAGCFSALLTYVAGMICFGCESTWPNLVERDLKNKLVRVNISDATCTEIWAKCASFGKVTRLLTQAVVDSTLAVAQNTPSETVTMFRDQQALCDWTHDAIAMHPFTTPSEAEREAAPPQESIGRRLGEYDAMKAGRASGFDIAWDGAVGSSGARSRNTLDTAAQFLVAVLIGGETLARR